MRRIAYVIAFLLGTLVFTGCAGHSQWAPGVHPTWSPTATHSPGIPDSVATALAFAGRSPLSELRVMNSDSIFFLDSIVVQQVPAADFYDRLWGEVFRCSGLVMPDSVRTAWTMSAAPGDGFIPRGGKYPVPGYTFVETKNIVVLEKYRFTPALVQHEMLHALLWENGRTNVDTHHAQPEFQACGLGGQ